MTAPSEYAVFALSFAASAAAPGPEIAAVLGRSMARGRRACAPLALGIIVGKLTMLTAAILGVAALVAALGPVFTVVQWLGAAFLVYLGVRKWRRARTAVAVATTAGDDRPWVQVALGVGMTMSNPIAIAFYTALLPGVVDVGDITLDTYVVLAVILVAVMVATVTAYGLAADMARTLLAGRGAKASIDRIAGTMFVAAGVWVAVRPLL